MLVAATSTPGEMAKLTGRRNPYPDAKLGVIEVGAYADILIVDGNPLEDISMMVPLPKRMARIHRQEINVRFIAAPSTNHSSCRRTSNVFYHIIRGGATRCRGYGAFYLNNTILRVSTCLPAWSL